MTAAKQGEHHAKAQLEGMLVQVRELHEACEAAKAEVIKERSTRERVEAVASNAAREIERLRADAASARRESLAAGRAAAEEAGRSAAVTAKEHVSKAEAEATRAVEAAAKEGARAEAAEAALAEAVREAAEVKEELVSVRARMEKAEADVEAIQSAAVRSATEASAREEGLRRELISRAQLHAHAHARAEESAERAVRQSEWRTTEMAEAAKAAEMRTAKQLADATSERSALQEEVGRLEGEACGGGGFAEGGNGGGGGGCTARKPREDGCVKGGRGVDICHSGRDGGREVRRHQRDDAREGDA